MFSSVFLFKISFQKKEQLATWLIDDRQTDTFIYKPWEHPTSCSAKKAVLQWVFCWEN